MEANKWWIFGWLLYTLWNTGTRPVLVSLYRGSEIGHNECFNCLLPHNHYPKAQLKTTSIYYLTVSVNREYSCGLAGWFWLKVSREVAVKILAGAGAISRLSGA